MSRIRKTIFWAHLAAGLVAGVVIAIMSATGIAIAFEEEILRWYDRKVGHVGKRSDGVVPLSISELREKVEAEIQQREGKIGDPELTTLSIARYRDPTRAWDFYVGDFGPLYVDPYSGSMQETRAGPVHELIHKLEEWHRWLGASEGLIPAGKVVTGVCNLAFVFLCLSGLYLWFPRRWSWRALRPLVGLVFRYKGKARDFNWHNVFGFWSLPVLAVLALTAVAISFEWGHRLVFALAGEKAPESRNYGMMAVDPPVVGARPEGTPPVSLENAFVKVEQAFPEWESITLEVVPAADEESAPLEFGVTVPDHMPSRAYIPVKSDPYTGEILQQVRFQDRSVGLQARIWVRFLHTGGAFGVPGKIIASLACVAALVLVWTGFALSWRRFFPKSRRPSTDP